MKILKFKPVVPPEYDTLWQTDDVDRIIKICNERGYYISDTDARAAWVEYSDSWCACWMSLGDDDDVIFNNVREYCIVIDE